MHAEIVSKYQQNLIEATCVMKVEAPFQGFTEQVDSMLKRVLTRKSEENSNKIVLIFSKYQGKKRGGEGGRYGKNEMR